MKNTVRKHIYFSGRVQGVGFRYRSYYIAQSLGLTGWVTNLWDGRVEMEVQGQTLDIQELLKRIQDKTGLKYQIWRSQISPVNRKTAFIYTEKLMTVTAIGHF